MTQSICVPWTLELELYAHEMLTSNVDSTLQARVQRNIVDRSLKIFHLIHERVGGIIGVQCYIHYEELHSIYYEYHTCLRLLYNCNLIFYNEGKHGRISHGQAKDSKSSKQQFCGSYQLSNRLVSPDDPTEFSHSIRSQRARSIGCYRSTPPPDPRLANLVKNRNYIAHTLGVKIPSSPHTLSKRRLNVLVKDIMRAQDSRHHGSTVNAPQYLELTFDDGTPFRCALPRHGQYESGRVYSALSCLPKSKRKHLLYRGRPLIEVGDIKSCFIRIVAHLSKDPLLIQEVLHSDIYTDCISSMSLNCSRDTVKPYFQKYLLATLKDVHHAMRHDSKKNSSTLMSAVFHYMESHFPIAHQYVISSPLIKKSTLTRHLELKTKSTRSLISSLQETEASLIQELSRHCLGTLFTVHDSILSDTPQSIDFQSLTDSLLFKEYLQNSELQSPLVSNTTLKESTDLSSDKTEYSLSLPEYSSTSRLTPYPKTQYTQLKNSEIKNSQEISLENSRIQKSQEHLILPLSENESLDRNLKETSPRSLKVPIRLGSTGSPSSTGSPYTPSRSLRSLGDPLE